MLCVFILWLCSILKPYNLPRRNAKDIVINSVLAVVPEKLCIIWTATRDLKQRKFYYPLNYRYGLNLQVNQKLSHVVLLILLAGDVATNPGPAYYSVSTNSASRKQVKCLVKCSRPVYNGNIRRKTVKRKLLENSTYFLLGSRLFINTSIAIILLRLSGDIESNPGPVFEIPRCLKRGLKVIHLNVRSLLPKIDLVRLFISKNPFDVFTLSETWLKPSITNAEINIPNYLITRQDRKDKAGGGTAIYVREGYLTELETTYAVNLLKHVGLKLYDLVRNQCLFVQPIDHLNFH
jgi:hypothetical protein